MWAPTGNASKRKTGDYFAEICNCRIDCICGCNISHRISGLIINFKVTGELVSRIEEAAMDAALVALRTSVDLSLYCHSCFWMAGMERVSCKGHWICACSLYTATDFQRALVLFLLRSAEPWTCLCRYNWPVVLHSSLYLLFMVYFPNCRNSFRALFLLGFFCSCTEFQYMVSEWPGQIGNPDQTCVLG